MAVSAKFLADFTDFTRAVKDAEAVVEDFGAHCKIVDQEISKFADQFSGHKVISEAVLMTEALKRIGSEGKTAEEIAKIGDEGVLAAAKLTLTKEELQQVAVATQDAITKIKALGGEVPADLQKLADMTKQAAVSTTDLATRITGLTQALTVVRQGFADLVGLGRAWVAAFNQQEDATVRLTTALRSQGTATPEVIAQMSELATKYADTTKFADELLVETEAMLVQIGNVMPAQMDKALAATTDLAAGLRVDLTTAARVVARALEGNLGALKRYGIQIDEAAFKTKGAAAVFDAIADKMGGQAVAQAQTFSGTMARLGGVISDVEEKLGGLIAGVLGPLVDAFTHLPTPIRDTAVGLGLLATAVGAGATAYLALNGALALLGPTLLGTAEGTTVATLAMTGLTTAIGYATTALTFLFTTPVGLAILGAAALAGGLYYLFQRTEDTSEATLDLAEKQGQLVPAFKSAKDEAAYFARQLDPTLTDALAHVTKANDDAIKSLSTNLPKSGYQAYLDDLKRAEEAERRHTQELKENKAAADATNAAVANKGASTLAVVPVEDFWTRALENQTEQLQANLPALIRHKEELDKLAEKFGGAGVLKSAKDYESTLVRIGGSTKLTADEQAELVKAFQAVIDKYKVIGGAQGAAVVAHFQALMRTIPITAQGTSELATAFGRWVQTGSDATTMTKDLLPFFQTAPKDISGMAQGLDTATEALESNRIEFERWRYVGTNSIKVMTTAINAVPKDISNKAQFEESAKSGLGAFERIASNIPKSIIGAVQGGGSVMKSIGSSVGADIGSTLGKSLGTKFTGFLGQTLSQALPGIGALLGPAMEGVGKLFGKLLKSEGKKVNDMRDAFIAQAGGFDVLAGKAQRAGTTIDALLKADTIKEFEAAVKDLNLAFDEQIALLEKYNITWEDMVGPERAKALADEINTLTGDMKGLEKAGVSHEAAVNKVGQAYVDLAIKAVKAGEGIPPALAPVIKELAEMGKLTDAQVRALTGMADAATVDFQRMEDVAKKYGIAVDSLGPKFQEAKIGATAQTIVDDFNFLVESGADVNAVIAGMGDELNNVVKQAITFGTALPAAMRPVLQKLVEQGGLTDASGAKLEDLSQIKFAEPLEEGIQSLIEKLDELIEKITQTGGAFNGLPTQIPTPTRAEVEGRAFRPGGENYDQPPVLSFAKGTRGRYLDFGGGTPAMLHGKERIETLGEANRNSDIVSAIEALGARLDKQQRTLPLALRDAMLLMR